MILKICSHSSKTHLNITICIYYGHASTLFVIVPSRILHSIIFFCESHDGYSSKIVQLERMWKWQYLSFTVLQASFFSKVSLLICVTWSAYTQTKYITLTHLTSPILTAYSRTPSSFQHFSNMTSPMVKVHTGQHEGDVLGSINSGGSRAHVWLLGGTNTF